MSHPDGGTGSYVNPIHTFDQAYDYVSVGGIVLDSKDDKRMRIGQGLAEDGITKTIVFQGDYIAWGNVCQVCWGYRTNCVKVHVGKRVKDLDQILANNSVLKRLGQTFKDVDKDIVTCGEKTNNEVRSRFSEDDSFSNNDQNNVELNKTSYKNFTDNEVRDAFEILLEEIEEIVEGLNREGAAAFKKNNHELASKIANDAKSVSEFRDSIKILHDEWFALYPIVFVAPADKADQRVYSKKLQRGLRTPENDYRLPILETLNEMGGFGQIKDVLNRVYEKMKDGLNEYDHQHLVSNPEMPRWYNTAQWCRAVMVKEGLLKSDSPYGKWEISDKGLREFERLSGVNHESIKSGFTVPELRITGTPQNDGPDKYMDLNVKRLWDYQSLHQFYKNLDNRPRAERLKNLLDWAKSRDVLIVDEKKKPSFSIKGKSGNRIITVWRTGGVYCFLRSTSYKGGKNERDSFVSELNKLKIFDYHPEGVIDGRNSSGFLEELDEHGFEEFILILDKHCYGSR